jgi:hypothetical protein
MHRSGVLISLAALLAAGCSSDGGVIGSGNAAADPMLSQQTAEAVIDTEGIAAGMLDGVIDGLAAAAEPPPGGTHTVDVTFDRTRACPLGGEVSVAGAIHDVFDFDTLTRETTFTGTKSVVACAFRKHGQLVTLDGQAEWDAFRRHVAFRPDGLQTASYSGTITAVREDGATLTCAFRIEAVHDPAAHTRSLVVSICGDEHTYTESWTD